MKAVLSSIEYKETKPKKTQKISPPNSKDLG
jgi:hypothetical protein